MIAAPAIPLENSRSEGRVAPVGGKVYLHPGQFAAAGEGCTMTTILGSCVGVVLHDPHARVAGRSRRTAVR